MHVLSANRRRWPEAAGPAAVAAVVVAVGSWRPALWYDENVTVMVGRRSWADVVRVATGQEAPIGPYYLLMKPVIALSTAEWWVRLPSMVAAVLTVYLLARFCAATVSRPVAVAGAVGLIALPVFSRYAQEARVYALAGLLAVLSTAAWWRLREADGGTRRRFVVGLTYAGCVVALLAAQAMALSVVVAHLVGLLVPWRGSVQRARRTLGWSVAGLVVVSPYLVLAQGHVLGVGRPPSLTLHNWWVMFQLSIGPGAEFGIVLGLAAAALVDLRDAARRPVLVQLIAWALLPSVVLAVAAAAGRPSLVPRYAFVALPAWAVLAGWGAVVLGREISALVRRSGLAPESSGPRQPVTEAVLAAAWLVALVLAGLPVQGAIRGPRGHDEDIRPVIAWLREPARAQLPVIALPLDAQVPIRAYAPDVVARMLLAVTPDARGLLYTPDVPPAVAQRRLAGADTVVVLVRSTPADGRPTADGLPYLGALRYASATAFDGWTAFTYRRSTDT